MGFSFTGFIGARPALDLLAYQFRKARVLGIGQELFLIPFSEELRKQLSVLAGIDVVDGFEGLPKAMEPLIETASQDAPLAYVEIQVWPGHDAQSAILWNEGKRARTIRYGRNVLETILRQLGAVAAEGRDATETLGFNARRFTDDWLPE